MSPPSRPELPPPPAPPSMAPPKPYDYFTDEPPPRARAVSLMSALSRKSFKRLYPDPVLRGPLAKPSKRRSKKGGGKKKKTKLRRYSRRR